MNGEADRATVLDAGRAPQVVTAAELPRIGRFPILRVLGRGGMGVVYSAFDEELGRRVAIKLLRAPPEQVLEGRIRMLREAQAMARLSHPNVAHIYEVGEAGDQVYIAMEYIEGATLRAWTKQTQRTWREVVAMYLQAGRGLAAAHAAGLVHRDFKPDNVLVGDDGRARVLDFGLARAHEPGPTPTTASTGEYTSQGDSASSLDVALTEAGTVLGTLAYMAPEQHRGEAADARSDQFSFCVSLWEGLYGQRPFAGRTSEALAAETAKGVVVEPARGRVPAAIHALLRRGLAPNPADRWPSMDALLAVLARDPAAVQRRRAALAVGVVALVAALYGVIHARVIDARRCLGREAEVAAVWDDERRAAVLKAISSRGTPYAGELATRVTAALDARAQAWAAVATEACESHRTGAQSSEFHALREACLAERLVEIRALVDELVGADATAVDNAARAVQRLPDVERCADRLAVMTRVDPPDRIAERIAAAQLRERLTRAEAAEWVGHYADGLEIATRAAGDARALGYRPLLAEALFVTGSLNHGAGEYREAERSLDEAWRVAVAGRHDVVAARAGALLTYVVGYEQRRFDEALRWIAPHALAAADRLGEPGAIHATLYNAIGATHEQRNEHEPAMRHYQLALGLRERLLGPEHPNLAPMLNNMAIVLQQQARFAEAEQLFRRALALAEAGLGPRHPMVATITAQLGNVRLLQGDTLGARDIYLRALEIYEQSVGPTHPQLSLPLSNLGVVYAALGDLAAARTALERALAILEHVHGRDDVELVVTLNGLADLAREAGDLPRAQATYERSRSILERAPAPDRGSLGATILGLGEVAEERGDLAAAEAHYARTIELYTAEHGAEHPDVAQPQNRMAALHLRRGRLDAAEALCLAMIRTLERVNPGHPSLAHALITLGHVLERRGRTAAVRGHTARAIAILEAAQGPDDTALIEPLTLQGRVALREGDPAAARAALERAVKLAEAPAVDPEIGGEARSALAAVEAWIARHR